jgi:hypothetical protein
MEWGLHLLYLSTEAHPRVLTLRRQKKIYAGAKKAVETETANPPGLETLGTGVQWTDLFGSRVRADELMNWQCTVTLCSLYISR